MDSWDSWNDLHPKEYVYYVCYIYKTADGESITASAHVTYEKKWNTKTSNDFRREIEKYTGGSQVVITFFAEIEE